MQLRFKTRYCPKCGAIMETLNTDSPNVCKDSVVQTGIVICLHP